MKTETQTTPKAQHTAGEWMVSKQETGLFILSYNKNKLDSDRDAICLIYSGNAHKDQAEANAKLIAAAPELLEALILCVKTLNTMSGKSIGEIQGADAIKKATE